MPGRDPDRRPNPPAQQPHSGRPPPPPHLRDERCPSPSAAADAGIGPPNLRPTPAPSSWPSVPSTPSKQWEGGRDLAARRSSLRAAAAVAFLPPLSASLLSGYTGYGSPSEVAAAEEQRLLLGGTPPRSRLPTDPGKYDPTSLVADYASSAPLHAGANPSLSAGDYTTGIIAQTRAEARARDYWLGTQHRMLINEAMVARYLSEERIYRHEILRQQELTHRGNLAKRAAEERVAVSLREPLPLLSDSAVAPTEIIPLVSRDAEEGAAAIIDCSMSAPGIQETVGRAEPCESIPRCEKPSPQAAAP